MAKQQPMWLVRDEDAVPDPDRRTYNVHADKPILYEDGEWVSDAGHGLYMDPDQSPVELAPGGGPVKVWLVEEQP